MKLTFLLLLVSIISLSSCTTAYKTGQTPDDVYYSPVQDREEYVESEKKDEPRYNDEYYEDRYLRMKVRNRTRWSDLDDWYYSDYRNRYNVYLGCCFCQSSWSPYSYWNTYHNPYYNNYVIVNNVKSPVYTKPRTFNLNTYNPNQSNTRNYSNTKVNTTGSNDRYTPPQSTDNGSRLRNIFRSNNSSSSGTVKPSTSSGSSGSSGGSKPSSSGSSAPVRRF